MGSFGAVGREAAADAVAGFLACVAEALAVVPAPAAVRVVLGRAAVVLVVEGARDDRGAVRDVGVSPAARAVTGRLAVPVLLDGAIEDLLSVVVVLPGDRVAAAEASVVLRADGFLFSSPEVIEPISGSASEAADLEANPVLLAAVPGAGRVGGLLKLDPAVLARAVEEARGRDVVVEARDAVVDAGAAGRRAPAVAGVVPLEVASPRRGGTASCLLAADEVDDEGILRRAVVDKEAGVVELFCFWGASAGGAGWIGAGASLPLSGPSSAMLALQRDIRTLYCVAVYLFVY